MAEIPLTIERIDAFIPDDQGNLFFAEIGRIVTLWGAVDGSLDLALQSVNQRSRNADLYTKLTSTQKRRRTALKNWLLNDPTLEHVKEDGLTIIEAAAKIQTDRDMFAHGRFLEFVGPSPPKIKFSKLTGARNKGGRVLSYDLPRLRQISHDLEQLRRATLALAIGATGDGSMPAPEIYDLARTRFPANLDHLHALGRRSRGGY